MIYSLKEKINKPVFLQFLDILIDQYDYFINNMIFREALIQNCLSSKLLEYTNHNVKLIKDIDIQLEFNKEINDNNHLIINDVLFKFDKYYEENYKLKGSLNKLFEILTIKIINSNDNNFLKDFSNTDNFIEFFNDLESYLPYCFNIQNEFIQTFGETFGTNDFRHQLLKLTLDYESIYNYEYDQNTKKECFIFKINYSIKENNNLYDLIENKDNLNMLLNQYINDKEKRKNGFIINN